MASLDLISGIRKAAVECRATALHKKVVSERWEFRRPGKRCYGSAPGRVTCIATALSQDRSHAETSLVFPDSAFVPFRGAE